MGRVPADDSPLEPSEVLARGSSLNLAGRGVGQTAQLVAQIVIARVFGPAAFGLFGLGWTAFRILSFLAPVGVEHGVVKFGSAYGRSDPGQVWGIARACGWVAAVSSAVMASALFLLAPWLAGTIDQPGLIGLLRAFSVGLPLAALLRVGVAATRVSQRMGYSVAAEYLLQPLSFLGLVGIVAVAGGTVVGAAWAATVSFGLGAALGWYHARGLFASPGETTNEVDIGLGKIVAFSLPVALAAAAGIAMPWLDRLVLAYFVSALDLGVYHAASQLALGLTLVTAAIGAMLAPMVADLHSRGDIKALNRVFRLSVRWGVYLALAPALVLIVLPGPALEALFGPVFGAGEMALIILTVGHFLTVATGAPGFVLVMVGRPRAWLFLSAMGVGMNVALNLILIPALGLTGAAIATSVSVMTLFGLTLAVLRREEGLWPYSVANLWVALPGSIIAGALWLGSQVVWPTWPSWSTLLAGSGMAVALLGLCLVFAAPTRDDRALVGRILGREQHT